MEPATARMPDWLAYRAAVTPERPALLAPGVRWSFAELCRATERTARQLASAGCGVGDRIATLLTNSHQVPPLVHAMGRLDTLLLPLNTRLSAPELAWQLRDAGAALLLHDARTVALAAEAARQLSGLNVLDVAELAGLPETSVLLRDTLDPAAIHSIVYTSGTTGRPKGALLSYGNHWWNATGSAMNLGSRPDDRWLAVLPLFHVGGMAILLRSVISGFAAEVHERFDPVAVNQAIDEGATIVSVVAAMLQRMLAARGDQPYPTTLRCVLLGGGPAPQPLLEECAARGIPVTQTYGLTETDSQVATLAPEDALRRLGSAGKPLYPNALRISEGGRDLPPGQPGEILVRGPAVSAGYAGRPEATAEALRGGWLHTGDIGYLDADGYLYVLDRRGDLIVSGGENVYPAEVEAALLAHPAVAEAGVIGVPDSDWGQVPAAFVCPSEGATLTTDDLIDFCAERLARYKVPRRIRIVAALPRNATGKLLRRQLREEWRG
ncbi:MAG TPA: o-succinylbenzoate--CoA ligase [Thermomicrobiaceae bacterium]|nr:o-succinylbenzoate--CoA ligase [Thermomicrobiaceae bacterium]